MILASVMIEIEDGLDIMYTKPVAMLTPFSLLFIASFQRRQAPKQEEWPEEIALVPRYG